MRAGEEAGEARTGREKEESCPPFSMSGTSVIFPEEAGEKAGWVPCGRVLR